MEKDVVTLDEEEGEITFVERDHDVECVVAILKNLRCAPEVTIHRLLCHSDMTALIWKKRSM